MSNECGNLPKILMVITDLDVGGVPLYLARLSNWLVQEGFAVHVASLAPLGPVGQQFDETRITISSCNAKAGHDLRALWRLRKIIKTGRFDLIQTFLFHANLAARVVAPSAGVPAERIICEIQTVEIQRKFHLTLDAWTIHRCAVEIGNSQSVIDHLHHAGIPRQKLVLIPGGIDVKPYRRAEPIDRAALGIHDKDPILLWTGRLDAVKNLDELIGAFAAVHRKRPSHLLLAGEGPQRSHLEAVIRQREMQDRVMLLGRRDDVAALLKSADVFVFPSRTEGLPNSVLEAMAAGLVVVATDVAGNRDLIDNARTGLLVPAGRRDLLIEAILRLLSDSDLSAKLAAAAFETVCARYPQARNFEAHRELYLRTLPGSAGPLRARRVPPNGPSHGRG